ncbi:phosphoribosylformylglycinamidine cyclo-ligase [Paenalkalicoccus suaedae]|uniref:Phosphoribosylformylglycinamidine cyclo-ligase n=1 Tax=Paenalkalicoccus suaedae TaxID=2592382 RepID=A0A859FBT4_9BACI|nr:phosphoribosylformylglycinamidine cyclo-ligase [Paenalkalicoccus suaedae]QKS70420.1 phosphoribosylformylglycinamidine cyclo-ligase [Paenalkalicoccus suaedae]
MSKAYESAGVNIEAGYEGVKRMQRHVESTMRKEVIGALGGFGGMFDLSQLGLKEPVLVSGTDGVGTKLMLAQSLNKHDTVGIDAVAMCVNDILVQGAEPLFFLDYLALGKNDPEVVEQLVAGVAEGCRQAGCALVGGETAEMPGLYDETEYDIAGFVVGAAEKSKLIDQARSGDVLIGIPSNGIHSNGFSLVRKIVADSELDLMESAPFAPEQLLGEALLTPTRIYVKAVKGLFPYVNGMAHITGGGFVENIPRMLPETCGASVNVSQVELLPVFRWLMEAGGLTQDDMLETFNCGIGMVLAVSPEHKDHVLQTLTAAGENPVELGHVTDAPGLTIEGELR